MTIKIVEYWLDRQEHETLCAVIDHLATESELNSITNDEMEQIADILEMHGFPKQSVLDRELFAKHVAPYYLVGRDMEDGYMVAIAPWDFKAAEVASL